MTGNDYNVANMMFFVPYILAEVPANSILLKFSRPSIWIGIIVTAWGIVMTCSGFCQNFGGLLGCRVLLGIFEYVTPRNNRLERLETLSDNANCPCY